MSHTVKIKSTIKDIAVLRLAAEQVGGKVSEGVTDIRLFDGTVHRGYAVELPGWKYRVAVKEDGEVAYDNYNGTWGDQSVLDKLLQRYGVETAKKALRRQGKSAVEKVNQNGSITLTVRV